MVLLMVALQLEHNSNSSSKQHSPHSCSGVRGLLTKGVSLELLAIA